MKLRPTQFGVCENTASQRQHASRLTVGTRITAVSIEEENGDSGGPLPENETPATDFHDHLHIESRHAATGGEDEDAADRSALALPLRPIQKSRHAFETLIGSTEAAKLLGNIHVKTLQRYARLGRLPGYQIGGHWYFRASELDVWLQLQINSNCQSVR